MKKSISKPISIFALSLTAIMFSFNHSNSRVKGAISENKFIKFIPSINRAMATTRTSQEHYTAMKTAVNTDLGELVDGINDLLRSASITSCSSIPTTSQQLKVDGSYSIHSEAVGSHSFPITELGITLDRKLVYKLNSTSIGVLYLDCDSEAAEVRYLGKQNSDDWDVAVAYADVSSGTHEGEHILMAEDYNAGSGYDAADFAVYYLEGGSTQKVQFMYNSTGSGDTTGYVEANVNSNVTGNTITDVSASIDEAAALNNLASGATFSASGSVTISL